MMDKKGLAYLSLKYYCVFLLIFVECKNEFQDILWFIFGTTSLSDAALMPL